MSYENSGRISFWERETFLGDFDVLIIGSGIVGLNAALNYHLLSPKAKIGVIERGFLPSGASTKNAGFACFGSVTELLDDLDSASNDEVFSLVTKRYQGLQRLRNNLGEAAIGYENLGGYEVFDDESSYEKAISRIEFLNREVSRAINVKEPIYSIADEKIGGFGFRKINHMIVNNFEGQINTGKMMAALLSLVASKGITILNNISVDSISEGSDHVTLETSLGRFKTNKVIVTTNGFARELLNDLDVTPARAQVLITKPIKGLKFQGTFHYEKGYYYFRNVGNRVLFGGGRNLDIKGESVSELGLTEQIQNRLDQLLSEVILPSTDYEIDMRWSGIMGVGKVKRAIVEKVKPCIFCGVRMGGMGVAIGSLIGEEVARLAFED